MRWKLTRLDIASSPVSYRYSSAILEWSQFHHDPGALFSVRKSAGRDGAVSLEPDLQDLPHQLLVLLV